MQRSISSIVFCACVFANAAFLLRELVVVVRITLGLLSCLLAHSDLRLSSPSVSQTVMRPAGRRCVATIRRSLRGLLPGAGCQDSHRGPPQVFKSGSL